MSRVTRARSANADDLRAVRCVALRDGWSKPSRPDLIVLALRRLLNAGSLNAVRDGAEQILRGLVALAHGLPHQADRASSGAARPRATSCRSYRATRTSERPGSASNSVRVIHDRREFPGVSSSMTT